MPYSDDRKKGGMHYSGRAHLDPRVYNLGIGKAKSEPPMPRRKCNRGCGRDLRSSNKGGTCGPCLFTEYEARKKQLLPLAKPKFVQRTG